VEIYSGIIVEKDIQSGYNLTVRKIEEVLKTVRQDGRSQETQVSKTAGVAQ